MRSDPFCVFFDLVGTLIRAARPIGEQYAEQAKLFGVEADPARLELAFRRAMAGAPPMAFRGESPSETAAIEREWWMRLVRGVMAEAGAFGAFGAEGFDRFFASLFQHFTTARAWTLFPDVLPVLDQLRDRGSKLGLITNYDTRVFAVLDALGLAPYLSVVVIPAHVGVAKPNPAIFRHALDLAGVRPDRACHVGDELDDDYEGARAAGLRAVLVDRSGKFRGRQGIRRVETLEQLLGG